MRSHIDEAMHAGLIQPCFAYIKQELAAQAVHGVAANIQLPNSDLPLAVSYNSSSLQDLRSCVTARLKILKAKSRHNVSSGQVWKAVYTYLSQQMPICRSQGDQGKQDVPSAHLQLIHEVQHFHAMGVASILTLRLASDDTQC